MKLLSIGQVAQRSGLGIETVRFYEREGLLAKPTRTLSGYRQFDEEVIARLQFIQRAKELGFTLKEIKELLSLRVDPDTSCEDVRARAEAKIAEIEEQALHSDVHLAEIAACHQLLTLIMSEPAKVPPTARQRMYNLVKGPEVDQSRMAPRVAPATLAELDLGDESEENVLVSRRGGRTWRTVVRSG